MCRCISLRVLICSRRSTQFQGVNASAIVVARCAAWCEWTAGSLAGVGVVAEPCTLDAGSELFAEVDVLESLPLSSSWAHEMSTLAALATSSSTRSMSSIEGSTEWVGAEEVVVCRLTCGAMSSQSISTLVHAMSGSQPSSPPSPRFAPPALNAS